MRRKAGQAPSRIRIAAIVPTRVTRKETLRLKESGAVIRISIENTWLGLYRSFAWEIFKRSPSVLLAFDGNSAVTNLIQEARNGRENAGSISIPDPGSWARRPGRWKATCMR